MEAFAVRGYRYNGNVLDTDHLRRITADAHTLGAAGVVGLDAESLCDVALTARRLRELADHIEVHALGALEPTGHTESTTGMSASAWFSREAGLKKRALAPSCAVKRSTNSAPTS